jgi:transposase
VVSGKSFVGGSSETGARGAARELPKDNLTSKTLYFCIEINAPLSRLRLRYLPHLSFILSIMSPPSTPRHTPHLSRNQRLQVQTLSLAGHDHQYIADLLKISVRQVGYAIHAKRVTPKKRTGRPRQLTNDQIDELVTYVTQSRASRQISFACLAEGPFSHWNLSEYVIRNALRSRGYVRRIARAKPPLSKGNQQIRLTWAEAHVNWTQEE